MASDVTLVTSFPSDRCHHGAMTVGSRTVLVVDDDASLRQALESVLVGLGYRVLTAGSPDTAYALLGSELVDAALLDVRLPTMSGLALCTAISHGWPTLAGCIAFITADADAEDVRPWLDHTRCTVFRKPFRPVEITEWLRTTLRARDRKVAGR